MEGRAYSSTAALMPLPPGHPFPAVKYMLTREAVCRFLPVLDSQPAPWEVVELAHDADYLRRWRFGDVSRQEERDLGFPWSPQLVFRSLVAVGGTLQAAHDALGRGWGLNLSGGTHHAGRARAAGFCLLNDVAITALWAARAGLRVAILDLDVHQGDGTAEITHGDQAIFTVSMHAQVNYPRRKIPSNLDLPLQAGADDESYLRVLKEQAIPAVAAFNPELLLVLNGSDVLAGDRFGRLALSVAGLLERDRLVFRAASAARFPVVSVMSGGYRRDPRETASAHAGTAWELRSAFGAPGAVWAPRKGLVTAYGPRMPVEDLP